MLKRKLRELIFVGCTAKLYKIARILEYSLFNSILGVVALFLYRLHIFFISITMVIRKRNQKERETNFSSCIGRNDELTKIWYIWYFYTVLQDLQIKNSKIQGSKQCKNMFIWCKNI